MPVFMDTHEGMSEMPSELRRKVEGRVRSGEKDEHGVVDRGVVIDRDANAIHCILEAPDEDAIVRHHRSLEVPIEQETIHRVDVILR